MLRKINSLTKDLIIYSRIFYLVYPFQKVFLFLYNMSRLTAWVAKNKKITYTDYFKLGRDYSLRMRGYENVMQHFQLQHQAIVYLEFGVASGISFRWWLANALNTNSRFYGFDTFEGLPENWGLFFKKGEMSYQLQEMNDARHNFYKGLFQQTLPHFIFEHTEELKSDKKKIIHLDADLFSSTLFVLSQLYPFLHQGDVIIFDEFNVPNHEFYAVEIFQKAFYVTLKPVSEQNNFYQTIFEIA